ncbi:amino acid permease/ SLC12A domain-containing protein [Mariannaea sp. PMI_226]|nr:amino acid permease/ SLC12A domain-containing protein [Mariannaea sp. PMI_226]
MHSIEHPRPTPDPDDQNREKSLFEDQPPTGQEQDVRGIETDPTKALKRELKARHISMIAIGGALGTGLILGTGKALAESGPGAVTISYSIVGLLVYVVMTALGEMAAWLPISAGFAGYATRFCDPSLGFALGWTYYMKYIVVTPNQIVAGAMLFEFWIPRSKVSPGVFVVVILIVIFAVNYFGVGIFGELEFWLSTFKVTILLGLIILIIVIATGGADGNCRGFRYWSDPGAFAVNKEWDVSSPALGKFLGVWSSMIMATFAYLGTELIGVTVGEAQNPRRTIPRAIRLTFFRILLFYCLSVFLLGLCIPYNSPALLFSTKGASEGSSASPFVVAAKMAGIRVLPSIINGSLVVFIFSGATSDLYIASRTLYGLASNRDMPRKLREKIRQVNSRRVPLIALLVSTAFCLMAFMAVANSTKDVFAKLVNMVTIFGLLSWISICVSHICFLKARRAQGIPDSDMPYVAPFGLWGSYVALASCCMIALTKNFGAFLKSPIDWVDLITGYIGIPIYLLLILVHKLVTKSKRVRPKEADFYTGKDVIDREEERFLQEQGQKREEEGMMDSRIARVHQRYFSWIC